MNALKRKDLNFIRAEREQRKIVSDRPKKAALLFLPIFLLAAGGSGYALLEWQSASQRTALFGANTTVSTMQDGSAYQLVLETEKRLALRQTEYDLLCRARETIDSQPDVSRALFEQIAEAGPNISFEHYAYSGAEGSLTLTGTTPLIDGTSAFVARLRASGLFSELSSTGYSEEQTAEGSRYLFTITGILKGREVKNSGE